MLMDASDAERGRDDGNPSDYPFRRSGSRVDRQALSDLAASIRELAVVAPADPGWDLARQAWNLAVDQHPALVAMPLGPNDVRNSALRNATTTCTDSTTAGPGHRAAASAHSATRSCCRRATMRGRGDRCCPSRSPVCKQERSGTRSPRPTKLAHLGLYPLSGSAPDLGVIGYTARRRPELVGATPQAPGLASNNDPTAIEVITPDGRGPGAQRRPNNTDLFWALPQQRRQLRRRDGLQNSRSSRYQPGLRGHVPFALRTSSSTSCHRVVPKRRSRNAPDEVTTSLRIMHFPARRATLPPFLLRADRSSSIDGAFAGAARQLGARGDCRPARTLAPQLDTWSPASSRAALSNLHMDPEQPAAGHCPESSLLGELDTAGLDQHSRVAVATATAGSGSCAASAARWHVSQTAPVHSLPCTASTFLC